MGRSTLTLLLCLSHEDQSPCIFCLVQKRSSEMLWFENHYTAPKFFNIPIHRRVANELINHEFDLSWFAVKGYTVALLYFLTRLVLEWHGSRQIQTAVNVEDVAGDIAGF